jgi:gluconolactonase
MTAGRRAFLVACAWLAAAAGAAAQPTAAVVRVDPGLDALVAPDAQLIQLRTGFGFTEGITWVDKGGYLLLSDIPANVIYKLAPTGKLSVYLHPAGYQGFDSWRVGREQTNGRDPSDPAFEKFIFTGSNGLALDPQGRLVILTYVGRTIERLERNGKRTLLADKWEGKRFGGPNDLTIKKNGTIYFTDGYGAFRRGEKDPRVEIPFQGLFMLKNGKVSLATREIPTTNGVTLSPDQKYLYANGSGAKYIKRFPIRSDDTLGPGEMVIDMSADKAPGITDGMKVDRMGNIYTTGPRGVWIVSPQGKHLGTILTPELAANLDFGDADHKGLYIAARSSVYKIRLRTAGIP